MHASCRGYCATFVREGEYSTLLRILYTALHGRVCMCACFLTSSLLDSHRNCFYVYVKLLRFQRTYAIDCFVIVILLLLLFCCDTFAAGLVGAGSLVVELVLGLLPPIQRVV